MKNVKSFNDINELYRQRNYVNMSSSEICDELYDVLKYLVKDEYDNIYTKLYSKYDMLYQMFKSDEDVMNFLNNIRVAVNNKDFYAIYDPINKIITKLIESNHSK